MSHSVLIADDSLFIREALRNLFEREEDFDVCGEAKNGKEAVEKARELHPDLILLDLTMQVMNGLDATRVLKRLMPEVSVIMFSLHIGPSTEKEALSAGASALVSKFEHVSVLLGKARSALEPKNHESSSGQAPLRQQSSVVRSFGNHHQPTGDT
jgi:two-component system chemotaxis response regulator CheY